MKPPTECPVCNGTDLHRERPDTIGDTIHRCAECENCGATWSEFFVFEQIAGIEKP